MSDPFGVPSAPELMESESDRWAGRGNSRRIGCVLALILVVVLLLLASGVAYSRYFQRNSSLVTLPEGTELVESVGSPTSVRGSIPSLAFYDTAQLGEGQSAPRPGERPFLDGRSIESITWSQSRDVDAGTGQSVSETMTRLSITFDEEGAEALARWSEGNVTTGYALVLDGQVILIAPPSMTGLPIDSVSLVGSDLAPVRPLLDAAVVPDGSVDGRFDGPTADPVRKVLEEAGIDFAHVRMLNG